MSAAFGVDVGSRSSDFHEPGFEIAADRGPYDGPGLLCQRPAEYVGLERGDVLATTPLAFRVNENGVAVLFRYGVVC